MKYTPISELFKSPSFSKKRQLRKLNANLKKLETWTPRAEHVDIFQQVKIALLKAIEYIKNKHETKI